MDTLSWPQLSHLRQDWLPLDKVLLPQTRDGAQTGQATPLHAFKAAVEKREWSQIVLKFLFLIKALYLTGHLFFF